MTTDYTNTGIIKEKGDVKLLNVALTMDNANAVLQYLESFSDSVLLLDLSAVTYCDSAGISVLITLKSMRLQQQKVVYLNPSPQIVALANFLKVRALLFDHNE